MDQISREKIAGALVICTAMLLFFTAILLSPVDHAPYMLIELMVLMAITLLVLYPAWLQCDKRFTNFLGAQGVLRITLVAFLALIGVVYLVGMILLRSKVYSHIGFKCIVGAVVTATVYGAFLTLPIGGKREMSDGRR